MYKDYFFKWVLKASVLSFLFVSSFIIAEDEETEAQGHGVCSYCSEVAPNVSKDENTNPNSVYSELNIAPPSEEKSKTSKGIK